MFERGGANVSDDSAFAGGIEIAAKVIWMESERECLHGLVESVAVVQIQRDVEFIDGADHGVQSVQHGSEHGQDEIGGVHSKKFGEHGSESNVDSPQLIADESLSVCKLLRNSQQCAACFHLTKVDGASWRQDP